MSLCTSQGNFKNYRQQLSHPNLSLVRPKVKVAHIRTTFWTIMSLKQVFYLIYTRISNTVAMEILRIVDAIFTERGKGLLRPTPTLAIYNFLILD